MSRTTISNGEGGVSIRNKVNNMNEELYDIVAQGLTYLGILDIVPTVKADPDAGDYYIVNTAGTYGDVPHGQIACDKYDALFFSAAEDLWQKLDLAWARGYKEDHTFAGGTTSPAAQTDPAVINTVTHTLTGTYAAAPKVVPIVKCDWMIHLISVNTTTIVIGVGGIGSATVLDYDLLVI